MEYEELRAYLLAKPGASEGYPFGPQPLVVSVGGKMFALCSFTEQPASISLKCDPVSAQFLRQQYTAVRPGYHLNKQHWNTITLESDLPHDALLAMVDESYRLVVKGLTRAVRQQIEQIIED